MGLRPSLLLLLFSSFALGGHSAGNQQRILRVSESLAAGQHVGFVRDQDSTSEQQPADRQNFFVVFPPEESGSAEKLLRVDDRTGEISLRPGQVLDHERESRLHFLAIPVDGSDPIEVEIEVLDENDNAPTFPVESVRLEFSEFARINTGTRLPLASDPDSSKFSVQRYRIAGGNVNNAFRLAYNGAEARLELVVNGQLDRERRAHYELLMEALDGGKPPKVGTLPVHVDILDANDNPPEFGQAHYSARVSPALAVPGIPILRLTANDPDQGPNGQVSYGIASQFLLGPAVAHQQVPTDPFQIDAHSGTLSLRHPLPQPLNGPTSFELVVTARDLGRPEPLESSATVQIVVEPTPKDGPASSSSAAHRFTVIWLTEDGTGEDVAEGLGLGQPLARVSVEGGGSKEEQEFRLSLLGGQSAVCLRQTDSGQIYLLVVCGPLDREKMQTLHMDLLLRKGDAANGDVLLDHPLRLSLRDVNDNAPAWNTSHFHFDWALADDQGEEDSNSVRLLATDADSGENARIRYSLAGTQLFGIDPEMGQLWLREDQTPCEGAKVHFRVRAEDQGQPPFWTDANVSVLFVRAPGQGRHIHFGQPLYELAMAEDTRPGSCLLQVSATLDQINCPGLLNESTGATNSVHYRLTDGPASQLFKLDPTSGLLCTREWLDFEELGPIVQLRVVAFSGDDEASAQVLIRLQDSNDNSPVFVPREYAVLLSPDALDTGQPLLRVRAIDLDASANFSAISYELGEGVGAELFRMDPETGTLRLSELGAKKLGNGGDGQLGVGLELRAEARDPQGRTSEQMALIRIRLLPPEFHCISFAQRVYEFRVAEDTLPGIAIGDLRLLDVADTEKLHFEVVREQQHQQQAGGPLFAFDEVRPNRLLLEAELDADKPGQNWHLLNVKVLDGTSNCTNFTQVLIQVLDTNDNGPEFPSAERIHVEVAEDLPMHAPFFAVQARDKDAGENGRISYELLVSSTSEGKASLPILVDSESGALSLSAPLDADQSAGLDEGPFSLTVQASDHGIPQRKAQLKLLLTVLDVNDNGPQFGQPEFSIEVAENSELMRTLLRAEATDADKAPANRRIRYRLAQLSPVPEATAGPVLGVNARTGEIFLRRPLDREQFGEFLLELTALDGGNPPRNGSARVRLRVLDVNDNAPNCSLPTTFGPLRAGQSAGDRIGRLEATDPDQGANGTVRFRLQQPNDLVQLSANGELSLRQSLSEQSLAQLDPTALSFAVIAEDQSAEAALSTVCLVRLEREGGGDASSSLGQLLDSRRAIRLEGPTDRELWLTGPTNRELGTQVLKVNATGVRRWSLEPSASAQFFDISQEGSLRLVKKPKEADGWPPLAGTRLTIRMDADEKEAEEPKFLTLRLRVREGPSPNTALSKSPNAAISVPANWTLLRGQSPLFRVGQSASNLSSFFFRLEGADEAAERLVEEGVFQLDELNGDLFLAHWPPSGNGTFNADEEAIALQIWAHPRDDGNNIPGELLEGQPLKEGHWLVNVRLEEWSAKWTAFQGRPRCANLFDRWNVNQSAPIGTSIGRVELAQPVGQQAVGQFHFELVTEEASDAFRQQHFRVDESSGEVFIRKELPSVEEADQPLLVGFRVVNGQWTNSWVNCVRQLDLLAGPQSPKFLSHDHVDLFVDHLRNGLYLGNIFHHFVAQSRPVHFSLTGESGGQFQLDVNTGALSVPNPDLLAPAGQSNSGVVRLNVRASSQEGATNGSSQGQQAEQIFTIRLVQTPRECVYFERSQFTAELDTETAPGKDQQQQFVANLRRKDGPGEEVELFMMPAMVGFRLDSESGDLFYRAPVGQPPIRGNLTLSVIARPANSTHFDVAQLRIVPNSPTRLTRTGPKIEPSSCGNLSVPEGVAVARLLRVRLLQPSGGGRADMVNNNIVFAVEGGNWNSLFSVDPTSGWLSCKELDRETMAEHLLMISATDLASSPRKADVCSVRVQVLDRNDHGPRLLMDGDDASHLEVPADARAGGTVLAKFTAEDPDLGPNGQVDFLLEKDPSGAFDLDPENGQLIFARETPFLTRHSGVWLNVTATDRGQRSSEPKRIRVEWGKRSPKGGGGRPMAFSRAKYVASVAEGLPRGQLVAKLELVNREGAGPVNFGILAGNMDSAFQLDQQGQVRTAVELDAEIRAVYTLHIVAFARERPRERAECRLLVRVLDRDDNAPAIRRLAPLRIPEDTPVGSLIASLSATDVDTVSNVEFSLAEPGEDGHFEIGRWTGKVHLAKALDYERQKRFNLRVKASDGTNLAFANLSVEVLDANDNGPQFERSFVRLGLDRNAPAGTLLAKLEAKDADGTERNSRIGYELIGEPMVRDWFEVDRNSGQLRLRKAILGGLPWKNGTFLAVKASDSGRPPLTAFCTVFIDPEQSAQDSRPAFTAPLFIFSVPEHSPPHLPIGQLTIRPNSSSCHHFGLLSSPANNANSSLMAGLFYVDFAGTVFANASLDREVLGQWLHLEATLFGCGHPTPPVAAIRIQLLDQNDHWPRFEGSQEEEPLALLLSDQMEEGRLLTRLNATDTDSPSSSSSSSSSPEEDNARLAFSILAGNELGMLRLDARSGELHFDHWDERFDWTMSEGEEWTTMTTPLLVAVHDGGRPRHGDVKELRLGLDAASRGPQFGVPMYRKFVEEDTQPGIVLFTASAAYGTAPMEGRWRFGIRAEAATAINETISVDPATGRVILTAPLDLEPPSNGSLPVPGSPLSFNVTLSSSSDGNTSTSTILERSVPVEIHVLGVDEYAPVFAKSAYTFKLPPAPVLGQPIGQVFAEDRDVGIGSAVRYLLDPDDLLAAQHAVVDARSGSLALIKLPTAREGVNGLEPTVLRLTVWAESGWTHHQMTSSRRTSPRRASASVYIEIGPSPPPAVSEDDVDPAASFPQHYWLPFLLLPFLLLLLCCLSALLLAKLFLRVQRIPTKFRRENDDSNNNNDNFLQPAPKKRVFTVANHRKTQLEQQQLAAAANNNRGALSPSFESGQFSRNPHHQAATVHQPSAVGCAGPNYENMPTSWFQVAGHPKGPCQQQFACCSESRRSQPDSGIIDGPEDRSSLTATEEESAALAEQYLRRLGIQERVPKEAAKANLEEAFLDELIYAPLEEIFGGTEANNDCCWQPQGEISLMSQLARESANLETLIPCKPLSQVLSEMHREGEDNGFRV